MSESEQLKKRIKQLSHSSVEGGCVLYVMSRDQRVADNHALLAAQKHALAKKLPLAVVFCLYEKSVHRAREHYQFMIDGLQQVETELEKHEIPFILRIGKPYEQMTNLFKKIQPDAVYFDFNPLRGPQKLQARASKDADWAMFVVDTHNVVPVWEASDKREVGAYTLRPKLHKRLAEFLTEPGTITKHPFAWSGELQSMGFLKSEIEAVLQQRPENKIKISFDSGEQAGQAQLNNFIENKLRTYAVDRNDPSAGSQSDLSPYLHFGQLSSLRAALRLQEEANKLNEELHFLHSPKMPKPEDAENTTMHGINALIEEMIVRKELADNFCYYDDNYDNLASAPVWARTSLDKHRDDPREHLYSLQHLEQAQTHDDAWNASQRQLTTTGKMHGYMRMYWAKKVLEWTESPEQAIEILIRLNDSYSIDGGDPNGYAGILWSVGGVHDRPWQERDIFGVVRFMNYAGLKRKFDIRAYEKKWE